MTKEEALQNIAKQRQHIVRSVYLQPDERLPHHPDVEQARRELMAIWSQAQIDILPSADLEEVRRALVEAAALAPPRHS